MAAESQRKRGGLSQEALLGVVVFLILLVRIYVAGATHLTEDEAYYRQWSMHLDLGYFDHPPMVAWGVRAGIALLGDNSLGVRIFPLLTSVVTSFLVFELARTLGAQTRVSIRAALWYNATITVGLGSFLAIPDSAAAMFWAATAVCLARADHDRGAVWWCVAGLFGGLTCLSKYSGLFLAPGAFLWLVSSPEGRKKLLSPWPWATLVIAAAVFSLNIAWNASHHWVTFAKQFGRVTPPGFAPRHLVELAVLQTLLFGPFLTYFLVRGARFGADQIGTGVRFIVCLSAPFCGYLLLHSMHSIVQQHWPVPMFAGASVLAAVGAQARPTRISRALKPWAFSGLVISVVILVLLAAPLPNLGRFDPALAVEGWSPFATRLNDLAVRKGAKWVASVNYGTVAQLQTERALALPTLQLNERDRYRTAPQPAVDMAAPGLVVDLARRLNVSDLRTCFEQVQDLGTIMRRGVGARGAPYRLVLVQGPRKDVVTVGCWSGTHLYEGAVTP